MNKAKSLEHYTEVSQLELIGYSGPRAELTNCLRCGAAIFLDPRDTLDFLQIHLDWHTHQDNRSES